MKRPTLAALAFFIGLATLVTYPLFLEPSRLTFPSTSSFWDGATYRWAAWWMGESLSRGQSFLQTDVLFYPYVENLALHPADWTYALLLQPILWFTDVPLGLNLHFAASIWLSFFLAGVATYWLAREVGLRPLASTFAGMVFATCGIRMCNLAQPNILCSEFLPLLSVLLIRLHRRPSLGRSLALGLGAVALLYNSRDLTNQALMLLGLGFVVSLVHPRTAKASVKMIPYAFGSLVVAGLLGLPLLSLVFGTDSGASFAKTAAAYLPVGSLDLKALFVPHGGDALYGSFLGARDPVHFELELLREGQEVQSLFLGFGIPVLALAAFFVGRTRKVVAFMAIFFFFFVLALGPILKVDGEVTSHFLPYAWIYKIYPPLQQSRVPLRFLSAASLGLALWSAHGFEGLFDKWRWRPLLKVGGVMVLFAFVLAEHSERVPIDMMPGGRETPSGYHRIARDEEAGSVLELPYRRYELTRLTTYYQATHGKPIFYADYPRAQRQNKLEFEDLPFFSYLLQVQNAAAYPGRFEVPEPPKDLEAQLSVARKYGTKYVTVHELPAQSKRVDYDAAVAALKEALRGFDPVEEWVETVSEGYRVWFFRLY